MNDIDELIHSSQVAINLPSCDKIQERVLFEDLHAIEFQSSRVLVLATFLRSLLLIYELKINVKNKVAMKSLHCNTHRQRPYST